MPNIHKKCWSEWVKKGNGTCIICREEQNKIENEEPQPVADVPIAGPILVNHIGIYIVNIVVYVVFLIVTIQLLKDKLLFSLKDEL